MILAGDIGATKIVLTLFSSRQGVAGGALHETRFESGKYSSLEAIIIDFLRKTGVRLMAASFGAAGPVREQRAQITNLPWAIDADTIHNSSMPVHVILAPKVALHGQPGMD